MPPALGWIMKAAFENPVATPSVIPPSPRLLVGLGNPGSPYALTRHNAGFLALEEFARREGLLWETSKKWSSRLTRLGSTFLLLPQTFMNLSGEAVGPFARFHHLQPAEILVVLDDFALPFGTLRWRARGSAGGHNGLANILLHLGTPEVPRLRLGIGPARENGSASVPPEGWSDFVLSRFSAPEMDALPDFMHRTYTELKRLLFPPTPAQSP